MSRRRETLNRINGLTEISDILGAMKGLALVELRRVGQFIETQRQSVHEIESAVADFLRFHREDLAVPSPPFREVLCIIGAERGFCGDFNTRIAQSAVAEISSGPAPERIILVGDKLADSWQQESAPTVRIHAPSVVDEVPSALTGLLETIQAIADERPAEPLRVRVLHHGESAIRTVQLLPIPEPPAATEHAPFGPQLNVDPRFCFEALADHYLNALLNGLYFDSLLEENRQRLQHMELALHRLDDQLAALRRRQNQQRQEEIIEEIEVILLTAN